MTKINIKKLENFILDKVPDIYDQEVVIAMKYAKEIYKGQFQLSGQTVYEHALRVAKHAATINLDTVSIITALLHQALYDERNSKEIHSNIKQQFGKEVILLVEGLQIINMATKTHNIYTNRTVLNYLTQGLTDLRIGLVKLCDVYENSLTIDYLSKDSQKRFIKKVLNIYTHAAVFYNLYEFKIGMETTVLRIAHPDTYSAISKELNNRKVNEIINYLKDLLKVENLSSYVYGRHKSPYSIYLKQYKYFNEGKLSKFSNIKDFYAFTIITKDINEAYQILDIFKTFTKIDYNEFDDYILNPKRNGYRAIHIITKLKDDFNTEIEIQIKTEEMYYQATYGLASHIAYKYSLKKEAESSNKFLWLENLHKSIKEHTNLRETKKSIPISRSSKSSDLFVRTPKGMIFQLSKGSTPMEFARAVHSKFTKVATSAKINGKAAKLDTKLQSGDVVEIILDRNRLRALST